METGRAFYVNSCVMIGNRFVPQYFFFFWFVKIICEKSVLLFQVIISKDSRLAQLLHNIRFVLYCMNSCMTASVLVNRETATCRTARNSAHVQYRLPDTMSKKRKAIIKIQYPCQRIMAKNSNKYFTVNKAYPVLIIVIN